MHADNMMQNCNMSVTIIEMIIKT